MPASRRARAMILAPRSWPSRPGLATTTRILRAVGALTGGADPTWAPPAEGAVALLHADRHPHEGVELAQQPVGALLAERAREGAARLVRRVEAGGPARDGDVVEAVAPPDPLDGRAARDGQRRGAEPVVLDGHRARRRERGDGQQRGRDCARRDERGEELL